MPAPVSLQAALPRDAGLLQISLGLQAWSVQGVDQSLSSCLIISVNNPFWRLSSHIECARESSTNRMSSHMEAICGVAASHDVLCPHHFPVGGGVGRRKSGGNLIGLR